MEPQSWLLLRECSETHLQFLNFYLLSHIINPEVPKKLVKDTSLMCMGIFRDS